MIIEKDNAPRWDPPTVGEVDRTSVLDDIFAPAAGPNEEWTPLT